MTSPRSLLFFPLLLSIFLLLSSPSSASPLPLAATATLSTTPALSLLWRRSPSLNAQDARHLLSRAAEDEDDEPAYPVFPDDIKSCGVCSQNYASLNSCMIAAPVFAHVSAILFNPAAFIDVIKCACTETFQAVYPQCVDCFEKTNQTYFLTAQSDTTDAGSFVTGLRQVCGLASALLGGVAAANSEVYSALATSTTVDTTSSITTEKPTSTEAATTSSTDLASPTSTSTPATSTSTSGGGLVRSSGILVGLLALVGVAVLF